MSYTIETQNGFTIKNLESTTTPTLSLETTTSSTSASLGLRGKTSGGGNVDWSFNSNSNSYLAIKDGIGTSGGTNRLLIQTTTGNVNIGNNTTFDSKLKLISSTASTTILQLQGAASQTEYFKILDNTSTTLFNLKSAGNLDLKGLLTLLPIATPTGPADGASVYVKADDRPYFIDPIGSEYAVAYTTGQGFAGTDPTSQGNTSMPNVTSYWTATDSIIGTTSLTDSVGSNDLTLNSNYVFSGRPFDTTESLVWLYPNTIKLDNSAPFIPLILDTHWWSFYILAGTYGTSSTIRSIISVSKTSQNTLFELRIKGDNSLEIMFQHSNPSPGTETISNIGYLVSGSLTHLCVAREHDTPSAGQSTFHLWLSGIFIDSYVNANVPDGGATDDCYFLTNADGDDAHNVRINDILFGITTIPITSQVENKALKVIPLIKARGSSILPSDFSGLSLWLRSDIGLYQDTGLTTPAVLDTDPVRGWADQSGSGNHFTSESFTGTGSMLDLTGPGLINGYPSVKFNANQVLYKSGYLPFSGADGRTVIMVWKATSALNTCWSIGQISGNENLFRIESTACNIRLRTAFGNNVEISSNSPADYTTNAPHITVFNYFAGESDILADNDAVQSYTLAASEITWMEFTGEQPFRLGGSTSGSRTFIGRMYELMVFSPKLTVNEVNQLRSYLNTKYLIY